MNHSEFVTRATHERGKLYLTGGDLTTINTGATDNIDLTAGGALAIANATAGDNVVLNGTTINAATLDARLAVTAITIGSGDLDIGMVSSGGRTTLTGGNVNLGSASVN